MRVQNYEEKGRNTNLFSLKNRRRAKNLSISLEDIIFIRIFAGDDLLKL